MVNHLRTLLLNVSGDRDYNVIGEEYVPRDFRAVRLSAAQQFVRERLFGAQPTRFTLNYRLRQLLTLLHSTDLAPFATDLDPRLTYDGRNLELYLPPHQILVSQTAAFEAEIQYQFANVETLDNTDVDATFELAFAVSGETGIPVYQYTQLAPFNTPKVTTSPATFNNLAEPFEFPGLKVQMQFLNPTLPGYGGSAVYLITLRGRPRLDLGQLTRELQEQLPDAHVLELFGTGTVEPYRTFRTVWQEHSDWMYRLSALLLATAYRIDERRVNTGLAA